MNDKKELRPVHGLIGLVVVFLLLIAAGLLGGVVGRTLGVWYTVLSELMIPLAGFAIILIARADIRESLPFRLPPIRMFFASVGLYIGTMMLNGAINMITSRLIPDFSDREDAINQSVLALPPLVAILVIAVVPALCEEIFCRGFLLSSMKSLKKDWPVILAVGAAFGILHMDLYAFLPTATMGALFAFIALKSGSLLIPILLHFFNNALSVVAVYRIGSSGEGAEEVLTSLSIPQTAGYVLFYLGIATAALYFCGTWFLKKKSPTKATVAVLISSVALSAVGYMTIVATSVQIVAMRQEEFVYEEGLTKSMDLELEEGTYSFSVMAISDRDAVLTLHRDGETVLTSSPGKTPSLSETVKLEAGTYTITLKTVGEEGALDGRAQISVTVIRILL